MAKKHSGFVEAGTPTPTPWRLVVLNWGYQIIKGSRVIAAISGWARDPRKDPQAYADALLLAAAPDLLAACEAAHDWLGRFGADAPIVFGGEAELATVLHAAIAKAHGESEAQP